MKTTKSAKRIIVIHMEKPLIIVLLLSLTVSSYAQKKFHDRILFDLHGPVKQCIECERFRAFGAECETVETLCFDENGKQVIERKGSTIRYDEQGYRVYEEIPCIDTDGFDTANYVYWNDFLLGKTKTVYSQFYDGPAHYKEEYHSNPYGIMVWKILYRDKELIREDNYEILAKDDFGNWTAVNVSRDFSDGSKSERTCIIRKIEYYPETIMPYALVEEKPSFAGGGIDRFAEWVKESIVYPESEKWKKTSGRVVLKFTIGTDGSLYNLSVLRGLAPKFDNEALKIVSSSPLWTPGKNHGQEVAVDITFPVVFVIPD